MNPPTQRIACARISCSVDESVLLEPEFVELAEEVEPLSLLVEPVRSRVAEALSSWMVMSASTEALPGFEVPKA